MSQSEFRALSRGEKITTPIDRLDGLPPSTVFSAFQRVRNGIPQTFVRVGHTPELAVEYGEHFAPYLQQVPKFSAEVR